MKRNYKKLLQYIIDSTLLFTALFAVTIIYESETVGYLSVVIKIFTVNFVIFSLIFYLFGQYNYVFRYISINDFRTIMFSLITYLCVTNLIFFFILFFNIDYLLIFNLNSFDVLRINLTGSILFSFLIIFNRVLIIDFFKILKKQDVEKKILIYGAGEAGLQTLNSMKTIRNFYVEGFIDDDASKIGTNLNNKSIFSLKEAIKLIYEKKITDILIAIPSISINDRRNLFNRLKKFRVNIKILPGIQDLLSGSVSISDFKSIELDDLIDRATFSDEKFLFKELTGKTILVTGAGGSIGSELSIQIAKCLPKEIILVDHSEFNLYQINKRIENFALKKNKHINIRRELISITNQDFVRKIFKNSLPDIVFHAAAYKHVHLVEENVCEAVRNNVIGTLNIIKCARDYRTKRFVFISTDKAVKPTNVMGATKRLAELVIQAYSDHDSKNNNTNFCIVRFGNVINSSGSVIPLFREQILAGGPLTVTHKDVTRFFMSIPEAAALVLHSCFLAKGGEVFVLDMGKPVNILKIAKKMISLSGLREKIDGEGDIEIQFVGLRKGEKMHEELVINNELLATDNPQISMSIEKHYPLKEVMEIITIIEHHLKEGSDNEMLLLLKKYVKNFNHNLN